MADHHHGDQGEADTDPKDGPQGVVLRLLLQEQHLPAGHLPVLDEAPGGPGDPAPDLADPQPPHPHLTRAYHLKPKPAAAGGLDKEAVQGADLPSVVYPIQWWP